MVYLSMQILVPKPFADKVFFLHQTTLLSVANEDETLNVLTNQLFNALENNKEYIQIEKEINKRLYELYKFTGNEINIIDSFAGSR